MSYMQGACVEKFNFLLTQKVLESQQKVLYLYCNKLKIIIMITTDQITYFNRHQSMDSETRHLILDTIRELRFITYTENGEEKYFNHLENWLYGTFDGYDYSEYAIPSRELAIITHINSDLGAKISEIFGIIEKYPRTTQPNNNQF